MLAVACLDAQAGLRQVSARSISKDETPFPEGSQLPTLVKYHVGVEPPYECNIDVQKKTESGDPIPQNEQNLTCLSGDAPYWLCTADPNKLGPRKYSSFISLD